MGFGLELVTSHQDVLDTLFMARFQSHITDAAVPVLKVAPLHEPAGPGPSGRQIGKTFSRELRAVLGGAKQRFIVGAGQFSMANTFAALNAEPLSPCNTDLRGRRGNRGRFMALDRTNLLQPKN